MTDEPRGIHLTEKQIVFGVMTATVAAVVVFLLGVFVGRGVTAARPNLTTTTVDAEVMPDPGAVGAPSASEEASAAGDGGGAVTPPPGNLTYPDRLSAKELVREDLPGMADAPPTPVGDAPESSGESTPTPAAVPAGQTASGPETPVDVPATKAPAPVAAAGPSASARVEETGPYTVQLSAFKRKADAQTMVETLKKGGFPAFVSESATSGDARFRVRVGSFKTRQDAAPMASRLQKAKYQPWITR